MLEKLTLCDAPNTIARLAHIRFRGPASVAEAGALTQAPSITVTTLQSFASRWLLPRIGKFQKLQPNVAVHIQASADMKNMGRFEVESANHYVNPREKNGAISKRNFGARNLGWRLWDKSPP